MGDVTHADRRFRGEAEALRVLRDIGARWGYGNCIEELLAAWQEADTAERLRAGFPPNPHMALWHKVAAGEVATRQLKELGVWISDGRQTRG